MKKNKFLWISLVLFFGGLLITVLSGLSSSSATEYIVYYGACIAFGVSFLGLFGVLTEFVISMIDRFKGLKKNKEQSDDIAEK